MALRILLGANLNMCTRVKCTWHFARSNNIPAITLGQSDQFRHLAGLYDTSRVTYRTCYPVLDTSLGVGLGSQTTVRLLKHTYKFLSKQSITHHTPLSGSDKLDKLCCTYVYRACSAGRRAVVGWWVSFVQMKLLSNHYIMGKATAHADCNDIGREWWYKPNRSRCRPTIECRMLMQSHQ